MQKIYGNVYDKASDLFNSPYDSFIEALLPAVNYPADLVKLPSTSTTPAAARDAIFKSEYLTDLATNPDNATAAAAKKQDLLGWNPKAPTKLCGGSGDPTVKFSINAQTLFDDFHSRGIDISLVDVDATIKQIYGSVLAADSTKFYNNYHSTYEAPLCSSEARKFFDLNK